MGTCDCREIRRPLGQLYAWSFQFFQRKLYALYIYIIYIQVICTYDGIRDSNHSVAPIVFQIENIFAKLECMENILLNWNAWKIFSLNWNAYKIFSQNWNVCTFGFFGQKHLVFGFWFKMKRIFAVTITCFIKKKTNWNACTFLVFLTTYSIFAYMRFIQQKFRDIFTSTFLAFGSKWKL